MNISAYPDAAIAGLNPLLIGAQCEPRQLGAPLARQGLNPLLIGAQCELEFGHTLFIGVGLNPLLIGAQCEPWLGVVGREWLVSQSPFDRGSV